MKLSTFFLTVFILTLTFCVYIQLQIQIVDLAYQGKNKESAIERLKDENGNITSNILKLKSSQHLGVRLLSGDSPWQFVGEKQIAQLKVPTGFSYSQRTTEVMSSNGKSNIFSRIFSLKSLAEAGSTR